MLSINDKIEFCNNEHKFLELVGKNKVMNVFNDLSLKIKKCPLCDYERKEKQKFKLHVLNVNEHNPDESICTVLCDACFYLKHFDQAVEKQYVKLVNSEYSQVNLIKIQRQSNKRTLFEIDKKRIIILKTEPLEYLNKIKEDYYYFDPYIKVIYGKNFNWDNSK